MNRRYYRFDIKTVSPIALGSGANENSDHDVLLDSRGKPFIPATAVAGVLGSKLDKETKEKLYGKISPDGDNEKSHIIFYDAELCGKENPNISVRDSVALENKVSVDGAKFDFEIVETGAVFRCFIEIDDTLSEADEKILLEQLSAMNSGILRFGHKSTRGYGEVRLENIRKAVFTDVSEWIRFDMYDDKCWENCEEINLTAVPFGTDIINLSLTLKSALSIRSYTTELPNGNETSAPDYKYLSLRDNTPVIPGTTWAGAFRERTAQLIGENKKNGEAVKKLFGYIISGTKDNSKSKITFSESKFEKGSYTEKLITRNSIDRFSSGINHHALYTELTIYGGKTDLTITLPSDTDTALKTALLAAIADLHNGFMAIGGLTSVGRGLFEVDTLSYNGKDKTGEFFDYKFSDILGGEQQ